MQLPPDMQTALTTAVQQWHEAQRKYETASRLFADAQTQLNIAERDLHELARAVEVATAAPAAAVAQVVSSAPAPIGSVTMPVVPAGPIVGGVPADGLDAAEIVRQEMMRQRGIGM